MANKRELLRFLDQKVFNPILEVSPDRYSASDRRKLEDVQDRTRSERGRFHHYRSAAEVIDNYKSDLHSSTARRVNRELENLKLPTLSSVEREPPARGCAGSYRSVCPRPAVSLDSA